MNIFDTIAALVQGQDPNQAVAAGAGMPPTPPQAQAAPPPAPPPQAGAPQGLPTPFTDPRPSNQTPTVTQSPPDLANMYLELMRKNQNAQQLDSGLTLIAAGLTRNADTRNALIQQAGKGGGNTSGMTAADFVNMQKIQQANQQQLLFNSAKQGLMKKYGLSEADMAAMTPDTANEIIKHHATQNLVHVQAADGSSAFYNATNGQKVADISGPKEDDTEVVTDQNTGRQQLISKRTGQVIREITGETKPTSTEVVKDDNTGEQKLIEKETGKVIQQIVPPRQPGQRISEDDDKLFQINKERVAAGKPPMTMESYLKDVKRSGVSVNVSPTGVAFPDPEKGKDYVRNPDGTVKVGPDGKPTLYDISGSTAERETKKAGEVDVEKAKKEAGQKVSAILQASDVGKAADDLLALADKPGVSGFGSGLTSYLPKIGGTPWETAEAKLNTINANTAFATLQNMRQNSPTGGALGQVSDFENRMLSSTIADLRRYQNTDSFKEGIIRVKTAMQLLADDDFNKDPAKFKAALDEAVNKAKADQLGQRKISVERVSK